MAATINADNGVVSGSAGLKSTADSSGVLALQSNGTTGLTLNTSLALGVGSGNSTGSSGQVLTSAGSTAAPAWATPAAVNLATGVTGTLPIANGGTGTTSTTFANLTTNVTGTLPIANGGTNSTAAATAGGIGYGTGTAHAYTSAGTSGQVLTSAGASAPIWSTPSSGALVFLQGVTASSSASVELTSVITSTYDVYMIVGSNISPTTNNVDITMNFGDSSAYWTSGYLYLLQNNTVATSTFSANAVSSAVSAITLVAGMGSSNSSPKTNFVMYLYNPATAFRLAATWSGMGNDGSTGYAKTSVGIVTNNANSPPITRVRFQTTSGTLSTGTFRIYGITNS